MGGLGGYPQGGLGPQAGRFQGPRAFWAGPRGDPANFSRTGQNTHFWHFWGCGVPPQRGLGPQAGRIQGPGASCGGPRGDPANFSRKLSGPQAGRIQGPGASCAGPRADSRDPKPPGPVRGGDPQASGRVRGQPALSCPETQKVVLCRLSSNPYRVREAKCLLGALTSCRAAGTGREDPQPDNNPFQLRFTVKRTFSAKLRGEAESKKAPLRGVGG